jgi:hypothetical protein
MKPVYTFRVLRLSVNSISLRSLANLLILTTSVFLLNAYSTRAEGTKQVMPAAANGTGLIVSTTAGFPLGNVGAYVPTAGLTPVDQRIFIHIKNYLTETLYYGFNWETLAPSGTISTYSDVYMNLYDPTGALVPGYPRNLPTSGAGFINTWTMGATGPHVGAARAAGYTPLSFVPTMNGDYYVNFYRSPDGGVTHMAGGESMLSKYFDLTVCQGTAMILGRIHCNEWAFSVYNPASGDIQDPNTSSNAEFFAYTADSVIARVYFPSSGFKPLSYILAVNGFGVTNGGNWQQDRKSINLPKLIAPYLTGGFNIFLNIPDPLVYPVCVIPSPPILLAPTISGCPPGPFNIRFFAPQAGDYYMILDLNGTPGYQPNTADRYIELISVAPGIITYLWDGKNGLGAVVPPGTKVPVQFSFRKGRINIPLYDDEMNVNGFSVDAMSPINSPNSKLYWDDSQLSSMGVDCSNNNNNYTGIGYQDTAVGQVSPGHAWNGNGNPTYTIPAPPVNYSGTNNDADNIQCNDFGNARLINTWAWGIDLPTYDTFTLTCITVSGTVWDDADNSANGAFLNIQTNSEPGTNAGNALYASLIDPVTGTVLSSVAVNANGTYTVVNCPANTVGMFVILSTTAGVNGQPAPASAIPAAWLNTSPLAHTFTSTNVNISGIDFGIEQLPNSDPQNYTIAVPPLNSLLTLNGAGTAASPGPLSGADPEDGILGSGKTVVITTVPGNEQLYYNNVLVTNGTTILNYNPGKLQVKFISITETVLSFQYAYVDAGGKQDPTPATYTINMSTTLAITLASFTGRTTDLGSVLSWVAENGTDGVTFTVQHSTDGVHFASIGEVPGNAVTVNYSFTDINPTPNTPNYYRLQWTSSGGGIAYSNIVTIASTSASAVLDVSPNPFKDHVNVRLNLSKAESVSIRLLDSKGMLLNQTLYQGVKGINSFPVHGLVSLPASVYFIQIKLDDQVFVRKVFNN